MRGHLSFLTAILVMCVVPATSAEMIVLSDYSSDETSASVLDATLEFSITGDGTELTLDVTNDTLAPAEFNISQICFNVLDSSNVTGLVLTRPRDGWELVFDVGADGFGEYDVGLVDGTGDHPDQIRPKETKTFRFDILGAGPFLTSDFTTEFSTVPPGETPALAAAKFVCGPGDDSAFGASVPEPAPLALLTLGGVALMGSRRR